MKVRVEESGPLLVIEESDKDTLWDYVEDWRGKVEIIFTEMTRSEIEALPDFEGF